MLQNYAKNRLSAIFLILFVSIGTFVFMKIFTAIMYNQFRGYLSVSQAFAGTATLCVLLLTPPPLPSLRRTIVYL
ncbi:unnamed protein product [Dibothriocephalus latus]|uniref:Uncharacterized protein n=1 Tax=Dibothriocephalus latus TaxID=60516 RepID=A0A3P7P3B7_DIBLA|nr:unnamed protein product [Dibothriocephalus latus]